MKQILYAGIAAIALLLSGCRDPVPHNDVYVKIVIKKYSITPAEIRVKQGDHVHVELTTGDVQHSWDVPELDIKESVQPGQRAVFMFKARRRGEFKAVCGVLCGPHHEDMLGKVTVE